MSTRTTKKKPVGNVAFVGAGPGDPELLTLRAVEALRHADIVVVDHHASRAAVAAYGPDDVETVDASCGQDGQPLTHAARAKLVTTAAKKGGHVVRLMDGDPILFHGFAEEASACEKNGIPFEVIPGASAVTSVPAYAGIPLTTSKSRAVHVVTMAEAKPDWDAHKDAHVSVVILGGADRVVEAAHGLVSAGRSGETPIAVTAQGSTTEQRTVVSTLDDIARALKVAKLDQTALAVVGEGVGWRDRLSWFESKPLFGWRVLVPRTKEQAGSLSDQLRRYGAVPKEVPTISVEPPRTPQQMDRALHGLVSGRYQWVAFTSVNAVRAIREKFEEYGLDARAFAGIKVAAVGEQTAASLIAFGVKPDLVPSGDQSAAGLLEDWPAYDDLLDPINRVFLPRADIATETLVAGLIELGWEAEDVTAYRTVRAAPPAAEIREAIKTGGFDAVLFTSSSTVRNLIGIAGKPHASTVVAVIGPQTAKTAEEHGLRVDVLAETPSVSVLAEGLAEFGAAQRIAALESGEEIWRPSLRKASARRKAK
ncbi:MAG TPA: bifunctional uroporphyrinogen-III C-methyltransferase/uroporphyrinogen-III synthase [Actinomycetes bacterium]|nr:bifunctional uroporphyrinogen-III C-methyltransferase/uroporphyrinogen-III synthase [Actinomycetes bacterium]